MKLTMPFLAASAALGLGAAHAQDADPASGETIYSAICANCHGPSGRGMASFPALAGQSADYIASRLMQYRAGEKVGPNSALMMPNAADLSDAEIASLAAFVETGFQ